MKSILKNNHNHILKQLKRSVFEIFVSNYVIVALTIAYIEINNNKFRRLLVI